MRSTAAWATEDYDEIAVEEAIMGARDVSGTLLRLPMVYGPGDRGNRLFPILKPIADGRPSIILPENFAGWRGPRGYVENVAHAVALAIMSERAFGRIFNVCEEPCVSELEWRTAVGRQAGWTGNFVILPVTRTPRHLLFPLNAAQHVVLSSERIRTQLGYNEIVCGEEEHPQAGLVHARAILTDAPSSVGTVDARDEPLQPESSHSSQTRR